MAEQEWNIWRFDLLTTWGRMMNGRAYGRRQAKTSQTEDGRYRLLVEAVTDYAIYMLDPNGIVSSWNPGAQRFKGYRANEIIGQHFSRFYTEEDRKTGLPARALETARREGKFESEGWRVRKDGSRFWAAVVIDPIRSPSGDVVGYAKITRDLTERKQAEQMLKISEEQFRLLVQGVTDYAIYMLDPEGNVSNWNIGAQRIKGYTPEEIIGRHFSQFYTEEDRANGEPGNARWRPRRAKANSKRKAGVSARTAVGFGRMSLSMRSATRRNASRLRQNHAGHHRAKGSAAETRQAPVRHLFNRRKWKRSAT